MKKTTENKVFVAVLALYVFVIIPALLVLAILKMKTAFNVVSTIAIIPPVVVVFYLTARLVKDTFFDEKTKW